MTLYKLFNAKIILDPSAGWGDRLISAIGCDVDKYVGVDPNPDMQPCYQKMIDTLVDNDKKENFTVIEDGFEYAEIPKLNYDLVFTSPPFFDMEKYSSSSKDSYNAYNNEESWFNDFLKVLIKKSFDNLIIGGHFVLYISESSSSHYINKMIDYTNSLMKYNGSIYYYYENVWKPRRIFVWKKVKY
jgi:tRNA1(Val) A37 N6-methylase TrmN6